MLKVLWFRFQQCLGSFTILHFEESSEMGLFRHLSNHGFGSPQLAKYISYEGHLFLKMFKVLWTFQK